MNQMALLGTSFACDCGRQHRIPTRALHYGPTSLEQLLPTVAALPDVHNCLLVADQRTWAAAGRQVEEKLRQGKLTVARHIVSDHGGESPVADDRTKERLLTEAPTTDLFIAVGSGVINDLVKWVAFLRGKPYIVVATAASMNGYASANVAASIDGLKVLFHAEACLAVFSTPDILAEAPYRLTASGLGDVLAKTVSSADWLLNRELFGDYYCRFSVDLLKDLEPIYLNNPEQIRAREPAALQALFTALFFSSVAMTITGTSAPASGGEHLISHTLDMLADRDGGSHDLHGRQVGVASILMAALYEEVLAIDTPRFELPRTEVDEEFWGSLTPMVADEYRKKLRRYQQVREQLSQPGNWQALRRLLQVDLVPAAQLKSCLARAGAAHRVEDIDHSGRPLSREKFSRVVRNSSQMRARFTILDLAALLGYMPSRVEQLIDRWLS